MEKEMKCKQDQKLDEKKKPADLPEILEEIEIEELAVDGICGIY